MRQQIVLLNTKSDHNISLIKTAHWLPSSHWKWNPKYLIVPQTPYKLAPIYLLSLLPMSSSLTLLFPTGPLLSVESPHTIHLRAFVLALPSTWNALPLRSVWSVFHLILSIVCSLTPHKRWHIFPFPDPAKLSFKALITIWHGVYIYSFTEHALSLHWVEGAGEQEFGVWVLEHLSTMPGAELVFNKYLFSEQKNKYPESFQRS